MYDSTTMWIARGRGREREGRESIHWTSAPGTGIRVEHTLTHNLIIIDSFGPGIGSLRPTADGFRLPLIRKHTIIK